MADIKEYAVNSINDFRKKYIPKKVEINYELGDDERTIKIKIPKDHYSAITSKLEKAKYKFEIIPNERKMELKYPQHNGKKLLKTKFFYFDVYFVEPAALKTAENIKNKEELYIKSWADFFESIDPEYKNLMKHIIDNIPIAKFKDEYNRVISKKNYWLDFNQGLFEKKEKMVSGEWIITYQPVTKDIYQIFKMFFKYFEERPLNHLADFDLFKEIISKTKYKNYLDK